MSVVTNGTNLAVIGEFTEGLSMYLEYWGFKKFPFENVPDPDFFYYSRSHEEALTRLIYAAEMRKGGALLSGEIGCGKTTLSKVYIRPF
jgi:type II secretory pathway predicted ATPase ExeA